MTRLEEQKKAVQVLMGEISEMNPLQIKALIEGRLVNARGPKRSLPVSLVTDGEGDEEILASGDRGGVEAWFGDMSDYQSYWLPAKVSFRGYWEQEEEG